MIGKAEEILKWLWEQDRDKVFEIKEHKEKRSLTANAYAWSLIGKIADALRTSKEETYLKEHNPELYQQYVRIRKMAEALEHQLEKADLMLTFHIIYILNTIYHFCNHKENYSKLQERHNKVFQFGFVLSFYSKF